MFRRVVIACVLASLGGCSALFARGPGSRQMSCTDSPALPIVDTLFAVGAGVGIGAVARMGNDCTGEHCGQEVVLAIPLVPVVLVALPSALYGYGVVGRCRAYKRQHAYEAREVEELVEQIRRLVAEDKCNEVKPLWDELLAKEEALNFEHTLEDMTMARCAGVLGLTITPRVMPL